MGLTKQEIKEQFNAKGLKLTPQRCAIYEMLGASRDHPTAEDIYRTVKRAYPMISQNTVYYTLSALKGARLISEVNLGHEHARFDANMDQHHHLVCLGCQKIEDLYDPTLDQLKISARRTNGYLLESHRVEFRGYCSKCRKRQSQAKQKVE